MTAAGRRARSILIGATGAFLLHAPFARLAVAGTEEWSTFDVFLQEEDDESVIDHLLARPPEAWRDEWERGSRAFRTSQGCLTSGQWLVETDLRLRTSMGSRARFGLDVRDEQSDRASFTYFDLSVRAPTAYGTPGLWFRPFHDKSRQDFSFFWEAGAETAAARARLDFTFEDTFNNFWAFRQTRVGDVSEPYERHPYEPSCGLWLRGDRGRLELEGQWLTPSRKRLAPDPLTGVTPHATLWGGYGRALAELRLAQWRLVAAGENRQARSTETLLGPTGADFRRQWSGEAALVRAVSRRLEIEARWMYQGRAQVSDAPFTVGELAAIDRVLQLETRWNAGRWAARVGGFHDRITVAHAGIFSYGTRIESRAYLGAWMRFGQVAISAVEGIELDPEPYAVWFVHDKAFLGIQSTF